VDRWVVDVDVSPAAIASAPMSIPYAPRLMGKALSSVLCSVHHKQAFRA